MWFYRRALKIPWTEHLSNEYVLKEMATKRTLLLNIRMRQLKFLGFIMRKEGWKKLYSQDKLKTRGKRRITYLMNMTKQKANHYLGEMKKKTN